MKEKEAERGQGEAPNSMSQVSGPGGRDASVAVVEGPRGGGVRLGACRPQHRACFVEGCRSLGRVLAGE